MSYMFMDATAFNQAADVRHVAGDEYAVTCLRMHSVQSTARLGHVAGDEYA